MKRLNPLKYKKSQQRFKYIEIEKISINHMREMWNHKETNIDDIFLHNSATEIINDNYDNYDIHNINDCIQKA